MVGCPDNKRKPCLYTGDAEIEIGTASNESSVMTQRLS